MTPVSVLALAVHSGTPVRIAPALKRVTLQMSILDNRQNIPMTYKDYLRYRSLKDSPESTRDAAPAVVEYPNAMVGMVVPTCSVHPDAKDARHMDLLRKQRMDQAQQSTAEEVERSDVVRNRELAMAACVLAISVISASSVDGALYGGRSTAHVWWYGWVTALSTGLGAVPMAFATDVSEFYLGLANAVAAGMMTSASVALIGEGMGLADAGGVWLGMGAGVLFILLSQRLLEGYEDVKLGILSGIDAKKALLIVVVMTLHSFAEGIGIGVSFGGEGPPTLGMMVTTTLAVHNVPEGFAVSAVLVARGMSVLGASLWSVATSLPQPLLAVAAYKFVDSFIVIQPLGLGFAAGAMLYIAVVELLAEALEACGPRNTLPTVAASAALMFLCQQAIIAA